MIPLDVLLLPLLAMVALPPCAHGLSLLFGARWREGREARLAAAHSVLVAASSALLVWAWWRTPGGVHELELPAWLRLHDYAWQPTLLVDGLGALYLALVGLVYPVVVRFSAPSFFREPGRSRYWFLVMLLASALWLLSLAGNLDTLFVAWELVGASSVLLIGFFRRQIRAGQNSLRALVYYRIGDFLLLLAAVLVHHSFPAQGFRGFAADVGADHAVLIGTCLLLGSLAKSAQLPMSPWLHRAMEGPAASSAIFYGALSVHLGPFLLLRTAPLWLAETGVRWAMLAIGLLTAVWAMLVGSTRPDAKTALAYSTMAQIGVMYAELAAGWHTLVSVHLFAHAGLRTWQFLRSSSLIQDFQDNPVFAGGVALQRRMSLGHVLPAALERRLYLASVRLFWLDALQWHWIARPLLGACRAIAALEVLAAPRGHRRDVAAPASPAASSRFLLALGAIAAATCWLAAGHGLFMVGLLGVLALPLVGPVRSWREGRRPALPWLPLLAVAAAAAHAVAPRSEAIAVLALAVVGGAFPCHLWLESLRSSVPPAQRLLLQLSQPGLALAVWLLDPGTATISPPAQEALTAWFVLTALVQTGLALVRGDPLRVLFAIGGAQSALLVAGALASDHGFGAEYLMLAGTDLGLATLALVVLDLQGRHRLDRLAPDHGLADREPAAARLFLVAGWLFTGVPGGVVFFAEDLLFHALAGHGILVAGGMILATTLGAVAFYRVWLGTFAGRPRPGARPATTMPRPLVGLLVLLVLAALGLGLRPQWFLGS
ncbi:MAG: hypothetical protein KF830_07025 [Planctomycetes bacterium]|nr:hypothetical protein [Planctomycetota bacterium]